MKLKSTFLPSIITLIITHLLANYPLAHTNIGQAEPAALYISALIIAIAITICLYSFFLAAFDGKDIHTLGWKFAEALVAGAVWVILINFFVPDWSVSLWAAVYALPSLMLFSSIKKE